MSAWVWASTWCLSFNYWIKCMGGLKVNRFLWAIPLDYDLLAWYRARPSFIMSYSQPHFHAKRAMSISTDGTFAALPDDTARSHYHCLRTSLRPDFTRGDLWPHRHPGTGPGPGNPQWRIYFEGQCSSCCDRFTKMWSLFHLSLSRKQNKQQSNKQMSTAT